MIEAAVAIAVVAILAGAIAPLAVKAINQQREFRTRDSLKACFEAMFGARDRRVANMRADFGFNPVSTLSDLSGMVATGGTGVSSSVPAYLPDTQGFFWGYNGPYWNGAVGSFNQPLDGWGRPIQLRYVNGGWQAFSVGADGVNNTASGTSTPAGDDLGYPLVPASPTAYRGVVNLVVNRSASVTGAVAFYERVAGSALSTTALTVYSNGAPSAAISGATTQTFTTAPFAGTVKILVTRTAPTAGNFWFILDVLPGEVKQLDITI